MRRYVGIDPGLAGAVASLEESGAYAYETPVIHCATRGRSRNEYDLAAMRQLLGDLCGSNLLASERQVFAVIEQVAPMPKEGVVSASRAGYGAGVWHALLTALGIPFRIVHPSVWKRAEGLIGKDKNAARLEASRRFPAVTLDRVKDHGRAEALLLADYARKLNW